MKHARDIIVTQARSWIGTNFHLHGRVKKNSEHNGGCDCLGLIMGIADALNISSAFRENDQNMHLPLIRYDTVAYGLTARRKSPDILALFAMHFIPVSRKKEGNVVLFNTEYGPYHMGIIGKMKENVTSVIHTSYQTQRVVEHSIPHTFIPCGYYDYFNIN